MIKLLKALEIKKVKIKENNMLSFFNTDLYQQWSEQLVSFKNNDVTKGQIQLQKQMWNPHLEYSSCTVDVNIWHKW